MGLFVKVTAIVAVAIVALFVLAFVLKIVVIAAIVAALVVGGVAIARLFRGRRNAPVMTYTARRYR
jgi:hypothetical protein